MIGPFIDRAIELPNLEDPGQIIVRFICALLFHFKFEAEIRAGIEMMKYSAIHPNHFENPMRAFTIGVIQTMIVFIVEIINLWNLSNITEGGAYDLMFDFIALGIIAEFDDYFLELYKDTNLDPLISTELPYENFKTDKRKLPTKLEYEADYKLRKIRTALKDLKTLIRQCNQEDRRDTDDCI